MSEPQPEPLGDGRWRLAAERGLGSVTERASVVVRGQADEPPSAEHARLAGARAWLSVSQRLLDTGAVEDALTGARSGIAELGDAYAGDDVDDDTELKALAAEDELANGDRSVATTLLLRVLESRAQLYAEAHPGIEA